MRTTVFALAVLVLFVIPASSQEAFPGLNLFTPTSSSHSYLLDMDGVVINVWSAPAPGAYISYMQGDESIFRTCQITTGVINEAGMTGPLVEGSGRLLRIDADDNIVWDYIFNTEEYQQHHDIQPMPNGNVLVVAWEVKTQAEAIAAGRVGISGEMWPLMIAEIEPVGATGGDIVWEWHVWDHLVQDADPTKTNYGLVAEHPERIDINFGLVALASGDWLHTNSIDYREDLDQIVFSCRKTDEFYVIDHSTTTAEAAGHTGGNSGMGGDIIYRWGNPQVYDRGDESDRMFHVIHGADWVDANLPGAGNVLAFDNGDREDTVNDYSTVVEVALPHDGWCYVLGPHSTYTYGPSAPAWTYGGPGGFYAGPTQGGAFRMPNGNTLVSAVINGRVFEVTTGGAVVWEHEFGDRCGRVPRYWYSPAGEPQVPPATVARFLPNYPNPFNPATTIGFFLERPERVRIDIFDVRGGHVANLTDRRYEAGKFFVAWDGRDAEAHPPQVEPGRNRVTILKKMRRRRRGRV